MKNFDVVGATIARADERGQEIEDPETTLIHGRSVAFALMAFATPGVGNAVLKLEGKNGEKILISRVGDNISVSIF